MPRGRPRKKVESKSFALKPGAPPCPDHLSDEARQHWGELVAWLKEANILSGADSDMMACYCEEFATWKKANDDIKAKGLTFTGSNGWPAPNAHLAIRRAAVIQLNKIAEQLGLGPLSRQRLHVSTETADASKDKFFKNREG